MREDSMPQPLKEFVTEASPAAFRTVIPVTSPGRARRRRGLSEG